MQENHKKGKPINYGARDEEQHMSQTSNHRAPEKIQQGSSLLENQQLMLDRINLALLFSSQLTGSLGIAEGGGSSDTHKSGSRIQGEDLQKYLNYQEFLDFEANNQVEGNDDDDEEEYEVAKGIEGQSGLPFGNEKENRKVMHVVSQVENKLSREFEDLSKEIAQRIQQKAVLIVEPDSILLDLPTILEEDDNQEEDISIEKQKKGSSPAKQSQQQQNTKKEAKDKPYQSLSVKAISKQVSDSKQESTQSEEPRSKNPIPYPEEENNPNSLLQRNSSGRNAPNQITAIKNNSSGTYLKKKVEGGGGGMKSINMNSNKLSQPAQPSIEKILLGNIPRILNKNPVNPIEAKKKEGVENVLKHEQGTQKSNQGLQEEQAREEEEIDLHRISNPAAVERQSEGDVQLEQQIPRRVESSSEDEMVRIGQGYIKQKQSGVGSTPDAADHLTAGNTQQLASSTSEYTVKLNTLGMNIVSAKSGVSPGTTTFTSGVMGHRSSEEELAREWEKKSDIISKKKDILAAKKQNAVEAGMSVAKASQSISQPQLRQQRKQSGGSSTPIAAAAAEGLVEDNEAEFNEYFTAVTTAYKQEKNQQQQSQQIGSVSQQQQQQQQYQLGGFQSRQVRGSPKTAGNMTEKTNPFSKKAIQNQITSANLMQQQLNWQSKYPQGGSSQTLIGNTHPTNSTLTTKAFSERVTDKRDGMLFEFRGNEDQAKRFNRLNELQKEKLAAERAKYTKNIQQSQLQVQEKLQKNKSSKPMVVANSTKQILNKSENHKDYDRSSVASEKQGDRGREQEGSGGYANAYHLRKKQNSLSNLHQALDPNLHKQLMVSLAKHTSNHSTRENLNHMQSQKSQQLTANRSPVRAQTPQNQQPVDLNHIKKITQQLSKRESNLRVDHLMSQQHKNQVLSLETKALIKSGNVGEAIHRMLQTTTQQNLQLKESKPRVVVQMPKQSQQLEQQQQQKYQQQQQEEDEKMKLFFSNNHPIAISKQNIIKKFFPNEQAGGASGKKAQVSPIRSMIDKGVKNLLVGQEQYHPQATVNVQTSSGTNKKGVSTPSSAENTANSGNNYVNFISSFNAQQPKVVSQQSQVQQSQQQQQQLSQQQQGSQVMLKTLLN